MIPDRLETIAIAATFTAQPIEESLSFWARELNLGWKVEFAPYNQVFPQLLDGASLLSRNRIGANLILIRLEDWQHLEGEGPRSWDRYCSHMERCVDDLSRSLKSAAREVPHLVMTCRHSESALAEVAELLRRMECRLASELGTIEGVCFVPSSEIAERYPVTKYDDPNGERLGRIPYTDEYFAALGTMAVRKLSALAGCGYKVIALDCDETLWNGVCGEDGPGGIEVDAGRRALQELIVSQHNAGMLVCLCSKNNEADILDLFRTRTDMPLSLDHIVGWRLNWRAKSENLKSLAEEMGLGVDSFILIDDNPVECAEVEAHCPEVLTLRLPAESSRIATFLNHVWAFDRVVVTDEDKRRTLFYRQEKNRKSARSRSLTLSEFVTSLELEVSIGPPPEDRIDRIAELTRRTNQFNLTGKRWSESDIRVAIGEGHQCLGVEARDRFGDYGLVGVMIFERSQQALRVNTLLLSCRALGRGVEHQMLSRLGQIAIDSQLSRVEIAYVPTGKNAPAFEFLEGLTDAGEGGERGRNPYVFKADFLGAIRFEPRETAPRARRRRSRTGKGGPDRAMTAWKLGRGMRIAERLSSPIAIVDEIRAQKRPRTPVHHPQRMYGAARNELEEFLVGMCKEAFGFQQLGVYDNFFDLGVDSVKGTYLLNKLQQELGEFIFIVALFDAPTVAELATYLSKHYAEAIARVLHERNPGYQLLEPAPVTGAGRIDDSNIEQVRQLVGTLEPCEPADCPGKNPPAIFVLGPPRSGTTLLRVMLAGHSQLFAPPEMQLLLFNNLKSRKATFSGRNSFWLEGAIRAVMEVRECDGEEAARMMEEFEESGLTTKGFYRLLQEWLGDRTMVDKTPSYSMDLEVLRRAEQYFENALYIHLVRHPYGMIRSFEEARLDQIFFKFEHSFSRRQLAELVWTISQQNILQFLADIPAHRQFRLIFEELVRDPKQCVERMCEFLNIRFHAEMLDPYRDRKKLMTDGIHGHSRMLGDVKFHNHDRIDSAVADSWKKQYKEDFLGEPTWKLAELLGYGRQAMRANGTFERDDSSSKALAPITRLARRNRRIG